jgi:hypothetical protein
MNYPQRRGKMNKIFKTIFGTISLVFLIASGIPLMTNGGFLKIIGYFNYFAGSLFLYFIIYRYFGMEAELESEGEK